ncbi:MAG: pseudouridine synthase [Lachnospiraceae bacterium]|nr:pseudouridine synthase [Lachnospiraceae bacterium]
MDEVRLNKYLSDAGVCSRREADRLIEAGRVTIDGHKAVLGCKVTGRELITVDSRPVDVNNHKVLLAYYKERGVVCSTVDQAGEHNNIVDRIGYPLRIYPIGRLDKDSEGLILLTNDGSFVNSLLKGEGGHEKEYEVEVDAPVTDEVIGKMERGGLELIEGRRSRPCSIKRTGSRSFNIVLTEGMNRQIRRMCASFGLNVLRLKRIRIMDITLEGLKPGQYRELDIDRLWIVKKGLKN